MPLIRSFTACAACASVTPLWGVADVAAAVDGAVPFRTSELLEDAAAAPAAGDGVVGVDDGVEPADDAAAAPAAGDGDDAALPPEDGVTVIVGMFDDPPVRSGDDDAGADPGGDIRLPIYCGAFPPPPGRATCGTDGVSDGNGMPEPGAGGVTGVGGVAGAGGGSGDATAGAVGCGVGCDSGCGAACAGGDGVVFGDTA